jgi:hypothetical protein
LFHHLSLGRLFESIAHVVPKYSFCCLRWWNVKLCEPQVQYT